LVHPAVAITITSSMICSSLKCAASASRSPGSILPGWLASRSVKRSSACSCGLKTSLCRPPGSFSAAICSSLSPFRLPEAVWLRVQ
jgi:hypothetical protein